MKINNLICFLSSMAVVSLSLGAQTLTTLVSFSGTKGEHPGATPNSLVQGSDGNLYGATEGGGSGRAGTIFKLSLSGLLTTFVSFDGTDGAGPNSLVLGTDGNFYGTTISGGTYVGTIYGITAQLPGFGTVYKVTPSGTVKTLHVFTESAGLAEPSTLVQAADGNFYGTTTINDFGGDTQFGALFKITSSGSFTHLYTFSGFDGDHPSALVRGNGEVIYGTTSEGGADYLVEPTSAGSGTIFDVTMNGVLTSFFSFVSLSAAAPIASPDALIQGNDGNLYGTTIAGGTNVVGAGTVFEVAPDETVSILFSFSPVGINGYDFTTNYYTGWWPNGLLQATDSTLYGTTAFGGTSGLGTVFQITTNGALLWFASFSGTNGPLPGTEPSGALVQASDGNIYGTTWQGGTYNHGTIFGIQTGSTIFPTAPTIGTQPQNETIETGGTATFSIAATGTPPLTYIWFKNGKPIADTATIAGASTATLTLTDVNASSAGSYQLIVTNPLGKATSIAATLRVGNPPGITVQPKGMTARTGSRVTLGVTATGLAPLSYQWFANGSNLNNGGNLSGVTTKKLTIADVQPLNAGTYGVVLSNAIGTTTSSVVTLAVSGPPVITVQPTNQTVTAGNNVTFAVEASSIAPLGFQWYHNTRPLDNGANIVGAETGTLSLTHLTSANAGSYWVLITNAVGSTKSSTAMLHVDRPPGFISAPVSATVLINRSVSFAASVTGSAPLTYKWLHNAAVLQNGANVSGARSTRLTITGVTASDMGTYQLMAGNPVGWATSDPATLIVQQVLRLIPNPSVTETLTLNNNSSGHTPTKQLGAALVSDNLWGLQSSTGNVRMEYNPATPGLTTMISLSDMNVPVGTGVAGYPEIEYGWNPNGQSSDQGTALLFPTTFGEVTNAESQAGFWLCSDYNITPATPPNRVDFAYDIWISTNQSPNYYIAGVNEMPTSDFELMIQLFSKNLSPSGVSQTISIPTFINGKLQDVNWQIYQPIGFSHHAVYLVKDSSLASGSIGINLSAVLINVANYLGAQPWITQPLNQYWVLDIELGSEFNTPLLGSLEGNKADYDWTLAKYYFLYPANFGSN